MDTSLIAAIDKFERPGTHVESEIERLRWVAHSRVAMVGMETRIVAWNLENSNDVKFKQRVREHIARFQQRADEAIRAVEIFQANMRGGERLSARLASALPARSTHPQYAPVMYEATANGLRQGTCPDCGSADTTSLKMIVANGTTRGISHGTTTGWIDGSGNQPGHSATFATTQRTTTLTAAAREASPPRKRRNGIALILIGVVIGGFGGWIGYVLAAGSIGSASLNIGIAAVIGTVLVLRGVVLSVGDASYNRNEYPSALARWSRSWQCQRCGAVFEV